MIKQNIETMNKIIKCPIKPIKTESNYLLKSQYGINAFFQCGNCKEPIEDDYKCCPYCCTEIDWRVK